jgi:hypothetical protein
MMDFFWIQEQVAFGPSMRPNWPSMAAESACVMPVCWHLLWPGRLTWSLMANQASSSARQPTALACHAIPPLWMATNEPPSFAWSCFLRLTESVESREQPQKCATPPRIAPFRGDVHAGGQFDGLNKFRHGCIRGRLLLDIGFRRYDGCASTHCHTVNLLFTSSQSPRRCLKS